MFSDNIAGSVAASTTTVNRNHSQTSQSPLAGATVELIQSGAVVATTTTDSRGNYQFTETGAGQFTVKVIPLARFSMVARSVSICVGANCLGKFADIRFMVQRRRSPQCLIAVADTPISNLGVVNNSKIGTCSRHIRLQSSPSRPISSRRPLPRFREAIKRARRRDMPRMAAVIIRLHSKSHSPRRLPIPTAPPPPERSRIRPARCAARRLHRCRSA